MKERSIFINVILNIVRVSLSVIFPLITFPYVSRVLMAENLGKVNYALSIENYFALIAMLGMTTYAVREGARIRSKKNEFQRFANEVFTVNIITTAISYVLLFLLLLLPKFHEYRFLILLHSISMILTTMGVEWLNSIYEDYFYITIRTFIIQIILLVVMFIVVKNPNDYYRYAFLSVLSNGITCVLNFVYTRKKYCKIRIVKNCHFFMHIKCLIVFFANNLAVSLYLNADTTMLGLLTNDYTVGIYAVSVKVYNVIKAIIAAMFTTCIPRLSAYCGSDKEYEYNTLLNTIINMCTLIMFPAVAGLILLSKPIILILAGEGYLDAISSLKIICIGIIPAIYGGIVTNCVNLPLKREKYNLYGTVIAAVINVILNLFFVPLMQENGAAITTVIAEFTVLIYCVLSFKDLKKLIDYGQLIKNIITAFIEAIIIVILSIVLNLFINNWIFYIIILIFSSIIFYILILNLTHNKLLSLLKNLPIVSTFVFDK